MISDISLLSASIAEYPNIVLKLFYSLLMVPGLSIKVINIIQTDLENN